MPPRHTYWTIILEGKPTAFRAHSDAELLPTFRQLQSRHPDVVMKWFSRGRLWSSPAEEQAALAARRGERREPRARDWRPGGSHQDPRDRFKLPRDEKRRRFAERMWRERREEDGAEAARRPGGKPPAGPWRPRTEWRGRGPGTGQRPGGSDPASPGRGGEGQGSRAKGGEAGRPDRPGRPGPGGTRDRAPGSRGAGNRRPGSHGPAGRGATTGGGPPRRGGPGGRKGPRGPGGGRRGGGHNR